MLPAPCVTPAGPKLRCLTVADVRNSTFSPLVVLEYNLSSDASYGVMTHYWSTGEVVNWDTIVDVI